MGVRGGCVVWFRGIFLKIVLGINFVFWFDLFIEKGDKANV